MADGRPRETDSSQGGAEGWGVPHQRRSPSGGSRKGRHNRAAMLLETAILFGGVWAITNLLDLPDDEVAPTVLLFVLVNGFVFVTFFVVVSAVDLLRRIRDR